MSSATVHAPVATAHPPRGWSFRGLVRSWRARRQAKQIFVAILHAADLPPGA